MKKTRLLICLLAVLFLFGCQSSTKPSEEPVVRYSNLNGAVLNGILVDHPIAVIIENYAPIRELQKGIENASIVYESLTEGGITRFLAIFNGETVDKIGPIRSARPYFLDFAEEYKSAFVHIGGSPVALGRLNDGANVLNIDEKEDEDIIWRTGDELPPHNAFTSIKNVRQAILDMNFSNSFEAERFKFKEPDEVSGDINRVSIKFLNEQYSVMWVFNPETNLYERFNGGVRHGNISSANVVVQFTDQEVIDDDLRRTIQTTGTGRAIVFRDGKVIRGSWKKDSSITKFYDPAGDEIEFNRGQTWIEVVPNETAVNYF